MTTASHRVSAGAVPGSAELRKYSGTIIISTQDNPNLVAGYRKAIEAYNRHQPDVTVQLELKGGTLGVGYPTWLTSQLASGNPRPDIVAGNYSPNYHSYVNFDYYRHVVNPYTGYRWDEELDFDWFDERNIRDERYFLALQPVHCMWFYNKDVFDRLGLEPPKTWREFMNVCDKVKQAGYIPTTLYFTYHYWQWLAGWMLEQYYWPAIDLVRAKPGDWCYKADIDGAWKDDPNDPFKYEFPTINTARLLQAIRNRQIRYDTPQFVQLLKNLKEITQYTPSDFLVQSSAAGNVASYNLFLKQEAVIHLDATWLFPTLDEDMRKLLDRVEAGRTDEVLRPFRWDTFEMPSQDNPLVAVPNRRRIDISGPYYSVIDKNQPQTDMVVDFLMFFLSRPGFQAWVDGAVEAGQFNPTGKIMIRDVRIPSHYEKLFAGIKPGGSTKGVNLSPFTYPPDGTHLFDDSQQVLINFLCDRVTAEEAADRYQGIMEQAVPIRMKMGNVAPRFVDHPELNPHN